MDSSAEQPPQTQTTLVNTQDRVVGKLAFDEGPPPIPFHTKPTLKISVPPTDKHSGEVVETAWMKGKAKECAAGDSPSDDEYWSAEESTPEEFGPPFTQIPRDLTSDVDEVGDNEAVPTSPSFADVQVGLASEQGEDEDGQLWAGVDDFDFDDESFTDIFTAACTGDTGSLNTAVTGPSTPGPSTVTPMNVSNSIAAHPTSPTPSQKKYYVVSQGRSFGIFDNYHVAYSMVQGVNGIWKGYNTLRDAVEAYKMAREMGLLKIVS